VCLAASAGKCSEPVQGRSTSDLAGPSLGVSRTGGALSRGARKDVKVVRHRSINQAKVPGRHPPPVTAFSIFQISHPLAASIWPPLSLFFAISPKARIKLIKKIENEVRPQRGANLRIKAISVLICKLRPPSPWSEKATEGKVPERPPRSFP
jgi:hypothetical protein